MAVVGDFTPTETTDPNAEPDEFLYFGETFEVPATVGTGRLLRFAHAIKIAVGQERRGEQELRKARTEEGKAKARELLAEAELTATAAMYDVLLACLGEDQIDAFVSCADANGVTQDGYNEACSQIQGVIAGRPTRRSSDSSDGQSTSGPSSTADGSGPTAPQGLTPREQQVAMHEAADLISPLGLQG